MSTHDLSESAGNKNDGNDDEDDMVKVDSSGDKVKLRKSTHVKDTSQTMKDYLEYEERENDTYLRGSLWANSSDSEGYEDDIDNSEYAPFEAGHHQHVTHTVQVQPDDDTIVQNFVGGSLPQCDKGDCEFYCCTMLTLFKSW
jgi:hypothetical protein